MLKLLQRLACMAGHHGPQQMGENSTYRSAWAGPGYRRCMHCGALWFKPEVIGLKMPPETWVQVEKGRK